MLKRVLRYNKINPKKGLNMGIRIKKLCLLPSLLIVSVQADILDRIEYKLGRVQGQVIDLNGRVTELENVQNGEPSVPFSNWDGNLYPVELASGQVSLKHVTGLSRFPRSQAALRIANIEDFGGIWWRNVVGESWFDINPFNLSQMIVGTTQDRSNLQDSLGVILLYTADNGDTWDQAHIPLSRCSDSVTGHSLPDFQRSGKPCVAFDANGSNAYLSCVSNNIRLESPSDTSPHRDEAIILTRSQDGGTSWNEPQLVFGDDGADHWLRSPTIWADTAINNAVYALWSDWQFFVGNGNNSFIKLCRSFDAGTTFEPPIDVVTVDSSIANFAPNEAQILVSPVSPNTLFLGVKNTQIFTPYPSQAQGIFGVSADNGATWSINYNAFGTFQVNVAQDPDNPGTYIRTAPTSFDAAISPISDKLYAVQQFGGFAPPGMGGVAIAYSPDGGVTWPTIIPVNPSTLSAQAFNPSVTVRQDGKVGVLFYDFRNHTVGSPALETDVWLVIYNDDLSVREEEIRVTPVSFDIRQAMRASLDVIGIDGGAKHYFLGDYCKLTTNIFDFIAVFPVTNPPYGGAPSPIPGPEYEVELRHRQDLIFARISP